MTDKDKSNGSDGRELVVLGMLGLGAFWYKWGLTVQIWLHEHMVETVLSCVGACALCGYLVMKRFAKKNAEEASRMRRLSQARPPAQSRDSYYRRRDDHRRDSDHE